MKHVIAMVIAFGLLSIVGCQTNSETNFDGYIIKGRVGNANIGTKIFLDELNGRKVNVIDTAAVDKEGNFELKGHVANKGLGRVRIGGANALVVLENAQMEVYLDAHNPKDVKIKNHAESIGLTNLVKDIQARKADATYLKNYIDTVKSPILAFVAINNLKTDDAAIFEKLAARLETEMPDSDITKELKLKAEEMKRAALAPTAVGKIPPDIKLQDPEGTERSLADLKGKVVLIDFWASWCRPCRKENPNVVKAYNKYKSKGFEIFSVSLDNNKDKWKKAIQQDGLIWDGHVSDLGGWRSAPAALYGVRSIPQTFLLDKDGKIIAKNLRGNALETKLAELLDKAS